MVLCASRPSSLAAWGGEGGGEGRGGEGRGGG